MKIYLTSPRGYCDGVIRAIQLAKKVRATFKHEKVSVLGMLVHNQDVINELTELGIDTIHDPQKSLEELLLTINSGIVIFTAHGHNPQLNELAKQRGLIVYDATCLYVQKSFDLITDAIKKGHEVIFIGKDKHPETIACLSISPSIHLLENIDDAEALVIHSNNPYIFNQTTLSMFEIENIYNVLKEKYPHCTINNEICQATTLRQLALLKIPQESELIYVVGGKNSANTQKLYEICLDKFPHCRIKKITGVHDIDIRDLEKINYVAIASGASTPKEISEAVYDFLNNFRQ